MRQASKRISERAEKTVGDIRRATHRHHSTEEKIRIVEGLRGEDSMTYPPVTNPRTSPQLQDNVAFLLISCSEGRLLAPMA
jgi:hypothetical protein